MNKILIVDSDATGVPFSDSEPIFDECLKHAGIKKEDLCIKNVIIDKKKPDQLDQEINEIHPTLIIPCGNTSLKRVLGFTGILTHAGKVYRSTKYNSKVLPIIHPSAIEKSKGKHRDRIINDLKKALREVNDTSVEKKNFNNYTLVDNCGLVVDFLRALHKKEEFSFDIESTGLNYRNDKILGIGFSCIEGAGFYVPLLGYKRAEIWTESEHKIIAEELRNLFKSDPLKIAHNGNFDIKFLNKHYGVEPKNFNFDTLLASHLIQENGSHGLKDLANVYTDLGGYESEIESYLYEAKSDDFSHIPLEVISKYCCIDVDVTLRLKKIFTEKLVEEKVDYLFQNLTMPLQNELTNVELLGVRIDREKLRELKLQAEKDRIKIGDEIRAMTNPEFKMNSTKQLQEMLFGQLKLPILSKTPTGSPSTDVKALTALQGRHPLVDLIIENRKKEKLYTTYLEPTEGMLDENDRLHTDYRVSGTATGRLCVSGDTVLETDKGCFAISNLPFKKGTEYTIITHTGKHQRILNKYYKGKEEMFRVTVDNGSQITCTKGHRFLTPGGWKSLYELRTGNLIYTYNSQNDNRSVTEITNSSRGEKFLSHIYPREYDIQSDEREVQNYRYCLLEFSKALGREVSTRIRSFKVSELLESTYGEQTWVTSSNCDITERRVSTFSKAGIKFIKALKTFWGKRIHYKEKFRISQDTVTETVTQTYASSGYRILREIEDILSRYYLLIRELLQRPTSFFYIPVQSTSSSSSDIVVYQGSSNDARSLQTSREDTQKLYLLEFKSFRDTLINSLIRFKNIPYKTVPTLQQFYGGFLFPSEQVSCRIGWGLSSDNIKRVRQDQRRIHEEKQYQIDQNSSRGFLEESQSLCFSNSTAVITEIVSVGVQDVWDIEVEGDHSYCSQGFINHNSSANPNVQNIPSGSDIRSLFVPESGWKFCVFDYNQMELRILAQYSQDPELLRIFRENYDIHTEVTKQIFNVDDVFLKDLKKSADSIDQKRYRDMRDAAKCVSFGIVYGRGGRSLAEQLHITPEEGTKYISEYLKRFVGVKKFQDFCHSMVMVKGQIRSFFGRVRRLPDAMLPDTRENGERRGSAFRQSLNSLVQGGAADCTNLATVKICKRFRELNLKSRIVLTVHDELVLECPPHEIEQVTHLVIDIMEHPSSVVTIPLKVDAVICDNWSGGKSGGQSLSEYLESSKVGVPA